MKVCCICTFFPPTTGGSETHTLSFVKYLADKGHDVSVIVSRSRKAELRAQGYDEEIIKKAFKEKIFLPEIEEVPVYNITSHGLTSLLDIRKKIGEIEKTEPIDVFDVHTSFLLPALVFKKRTTILSLHFYEPSCPRFGWPQKFMQDHFILDPSHAFYSYNKCVLQKRCVSTADYIRWRIVRFYALNKVDRIVVKKKNLKDLFMKTGVEEHKISVIPYWIDAEAIHNKSMDKNNMVKIPQIVNSDFVFTSVGRLVPPKGPILLLKAFELVTEKFQNIKLMYIGDGTLRKRVEQLADKMNIRDKIILMGRIPHESIIKFFSISHAFVHTQRYTNYGWALLETMATGKPIIATNVGPTSDILRNGYNALIAEPNPESLASKMIQLASNRKLARELGVHALKTVKEKHSYKNLEKYELLLKDCLAQ